MKYYGVRQTSHGADHVFVFSEEDIKREIEAGYLGREDFEKYFPDNPEEGTEVAFFPWGGSNVSDGFVELLEDEEAAYNYLTQRDAMGPDLEDPCLVDMAEYYWKVEVHEGCAGEILAKRGITVEEVEKRAIEDHESKMAYITKALGDIDFYSGEYRDVRASDAYIVGDVKEAVEGTFFERGIFENGPIALVKIPKVTANHMLMADGFNIFEEKEMPDKTYLHIEKDEDGGISWDIIEHAGGNTLNKLTCENNSFVREQISKIIADAVEKSEQKDEVER